MRLTNEPSPIDPRGLGPRRGQRAREPPLSKGGCGFSLRLYLGTSWGKSHRHLNLDFLKSFPLNLLRFPPKFRFPRVPPRAARLQAEPAFSDA